MGFYCYVQNDSGGSFIDDPRRGIGHYVIVQADSATEANERAESIGLYFDGVAHRIDCGCCGDRWTAQWSDALSYVEPSVYSESVFGRTDTFIHFRGGVFLRADETCQPVVHDLRVLLAEE